MICSLASLKSPSTSYSWYRDCVYGFATRLSSGLIGLRLLRDDTCFSSYYFRNSNVLTSLLLTSFRFCFVIIVVMFATLVCMFSPLNLLVYRLDCAPFAALLVNLLTLEFLKSIGIFLSLLPELTSC